jgi:DNA-binding response OmpR family regulator
LTSPRTTVLVADDEEDILSFVSTKLRRADIDVVLAHNGTEALEALTAGGIDLGVIDVMMPGMTGIEVIRETRNGTGPSAKIPLILLTAKAQETDVELGFNVGATDYVTKPFSPHELLVRINAALSRW